MVPVSFPERIPRPRRPAFSAFSPETLVVPSQRSSALLQCSFVQRILQAPCHVRLRQHRYNEFTSTRHFEVTSNNRVVGALTFDWITSILTHLIRENSSSA